MEYKDIRIGKQQITQFLNKYFKENEDYKILNNNDFDINNFCFAHKAAKNNDEEKRGLHNKHYITVYPDYFKELCMHVGTKKSKEIKKYYIELEKIFKFYLEYQNQYKELLLEEKDKQIEEEKNKNTHI